MINSIIAETLYDFPSVNEAQKLFDTIQFPPFLGTLSNSTNMNVDRWQSSLYNLVKIKENIIMIS